MKINKNKLELIQNISKETREEMLKKIQEDLKCEFPEELLNDLLNLHIFLDSNELYTILEGDDKEEWEFEYDFTIKKEAINKKFGNPDLIDAYIDHILRNYSPITIITDTEQEYKACITLSKKL